MGSVIERISEQNKILMLERIEIIVNGVQYTWHYSSMLELEPKEEYFGLYNYQLKERHHTRRRDIPINMVVKHCLDMGIINISCLRMIEMFEQYIVHSEGMNRDIVKKLGSMKMAIDNLSLGKDLQR